MTPHERLLHLALREVVGGETPPDLAPRILAATIRPRRPRARLPLVAAAAAVAALALLLWPRETPFPRDAETGRAIEVPAEREGPLRVLFAEDVELALEDGARATLRRADATLHEGRAAARGALLVRTPHGDARFEEGAAGELDVDATRLVLRVDTGRAQVGERVVDAGGSLTLPEPLPIEQRRELDSLVWALSREGMEAMKAAVELNALLARFPARRAYVRDELLALLEGASPDARVVLLELLAHDPATRPRTAAAVEADAARFNLDTILLLFEEGLPAAREELARRVREAGEAIPGVVPAAALALAGDGRGRATLRWFLGSPRPGRYLTRRFAAAAGLRELGEEAWAEALSFARREAGHHLAADRVVQAADVALRAGYFAPREDIRLSYLLQRMFAFKQPRILELDTAAKVRAYLDELEGR